MAGSERRYRTRSLSRAESQPLSPSRGDRNGTLQPTNTNYSQAMGPRDGLFLNAHATGTRLASHRSFSVVPELPSQDLGFPPLEPESPTDIILENRQKRQNTNRLEQQPVLSHLDDSAHQKNLLPLQSMASFAQLPVKSSQSSSTGFPTNVPHNLVSHVEGDDKHLPPITSSQLPENGGDMPHRRHYVSKVPEHSPIFEDPHQEYESLGSPAEGPSVHTPTNAIEPHPLRVHDVRDRDDSTVKEATHSSNKSLGEHQVGKSTDHKGSERSKHEVGLRGEIDVSVSGNDMDNKANWSDSGIDSDDNSEEDDDSKDVSHRKTGRVSHATSAILSQGFAQINQLFGDLEQKSKMSAQRLLRHYNNHRNLNGGARATNHWNLYQPYFRQHQDEECAQLESNELQGCTEAQIVKRCYDKFQKRYSRNDAWKIILERSEELEEAADQGLPSIASRTRLFNKSLSSMEEIANHESSLNKFEYLILACGALVNSDGSLVWVSGTPLTQGFLQKLLLPGIDVDELQGHFKTHVYEQNRVERLKFLNSQVTVMNAVPLASTSAALRQLPDVKNSLNVDSKAIPSREVIVADQAEAHDSTAEGIRDWVRRQMSAAGVNPKSDKKLAWRKLPSEFGTNGLYWKNYPEDVRFPTEVAAGRGISALTKKEMEVLCMQMNDPTHPMAILKATDRKGVRAYLSQEMVVIEGVPPDSESLHAFGRVLYRTGKTERKGLPRLWPNRPDQLRESMDNTGPDLAEGSGGPATTDDSPAGDQMQAKGKETEVVSTQGLSVDNDAQSNLKRPRSPSHQEHLSEPPTKIPRQDSSQSVARSSHIAKPDTASHKSSTSQSKTLKFSVALPSQPHPEATGDAGSEKAQRRMTEMIDERIESSPGITETTRVHTAVEPENAVSAQPMSPSHPHTNVTSDQPHSRPRPRPIHKGSNRTELLKRNKEHQGTSDNDGSIIDGPSRTDEIPKSGSLILPPSNSSGMRDERGELNGVIRQHNKLHIPQPQVLTFPASTLASTTRPISSMSFDPSTAASHNSSSRSRGPSRAPSGRPPSARGSFTQPTFPHLSFMPGPHRQGSASTYHHPTVGPTLPPISEMTDFSADWYTSPRYLDGPATQGVHHTMFPGIQSARDQDNYHSEMGNTPHYLSAERAPSTAPFDHHSHPIPRHGTQNVGGYYRPQTGLPMHHDPYSDHGDSVHMRTDVDMHMNQFIPSMMNTNHNNIHMFDMSNALSEESMSTAGQGYFSADIGAGTGGDISVAGLGPSTMSHLHQETHLRQADPVISIPPTLREVYGHGPQERLDGSSTSMRWNNGMK